MYFEKIKVGIRSLLNLKLKKNTTLKQKNSPNSISANMSGIGNQQIITVNKSNSKDIQAVNDSLKKLRCFEKIFNDLLPERNESRYIQLLKYAHDALKELKQSLRLLESYSGISGRLEAIEELVHILENGSARYPGHTFREFCDEVDPLWIKELEELLIEIYHKQS